MPTPFEADVALIYISGGSSRSTPPPGTIAQSAPRRAARSRANDLLFISLGLSPTRAAPSGLIAHLANMSADAYYGTAGSVTLGMREAANAINDHLIAINRDESGSARLQARLIMAVLRDGNLYIAQCGIGQSILIRPNQVTRFISEEASQRPLGVTYSPFLRFFHLEVQAGDLFILTTEDPPSWPEPTLAQLAGLNPVQALERILPETKRDMTGMIVGVASPGEEIRSSPKPLDMPRRDISGPASSVQRRVSHRPSEKPAIAKKPSNFSRFVMGFSKGIRSTISAIGFSLAKTMARLSPGLSEPVPGMYSPKVLALTAILVPIFLAVIAALVYQRIGRAQQFELDMADARATIALAETKTNSTEMREEWANALWYLDQAEKYGASQEASRLHEKVQSELDRLDLIIRVDYQAVISGGFGIGSDLSAMAASSTDLYILDEGNKTIWHIWWTGRSFDRDGNFQCLPDKENPGTMSTPIDLAIVPEPSALGVESLIAIDEDGTLIYCAPDKFPTTAELARPGDGWGKIQAIDLYNDRLYLLDPPHNAIWMYDASNGFISGDPTPYFTLSPPNLTDAIDLVGTQEGLLILFSDGHLDRCLRDADAPSEETTETARGCETLAFVDERAGHIESNSIPNAEAIGLIYSPPPEPSLYFLDALNGNIIQYSLRLVYQTQYVPKISFEDQLTAFTLGPPNHLYIAAGSQVFHVQLGR
jgi:hypothetical protein